MCCSISIPCFNSLALQFESVCINAVTYNLEGISPTVFSTPEEFCSTNYSYCDLVTTATTVCTGIPVFHNVPYKVLNFVYYSEATGDYTLDDPTAGNFFGFTFVDVDNEPVILGEIDPECYTRLCFVKQQDTSVITKFKLKLLYLQCDYANQVFKYIQNLRFGLDTSKQLLNLKKVKNALVLLNQYDTRDILYNQTIYNTMTYKEIKEIINSIEY